MKKEEYLKQLVKEKDIKVSQILKEHWAEFKKTKLHRVPEDMRKSVVEAVEKALGCGDISKGYTKYKCIECDSGHEVIIGHSCKSRFCNRCGKVYVENWVNKQVETILDVTHRHTVFTVPEELRKEIYWNRDLLKDISDGIYGVISYWYEKMGKSREYMPGVITVVHTFGRSLDFNPHIHALVTEGALDKDKKWKAVKYIPYEYLRKAWQKVLMDIVKKKLVPKKPQLKKLINELYKRYPQGFYVHAETKMDGAKRAAQYIGRYLARPAIAEYRIISYDGETVKFWYEDHKTGEVMERELPVLEFIGKIIMHIPKKNFKMVRRYGLYRRDLNKLSKKSVELQVYYKGKPKEKTDTEKKTWKQRIIESFGKNPIKCPKCGKEMELWEIWNEKSGTIYHIFDEWKSLKEVPDLNAKEKERDGLRRRDSLRRPGGDKEGYVQISLQGLCI
jgi:ribosomal protein S27E